MKKFTSHGLTFTKYGFLLQLQQIFRFLLLFFRISGQFAENFSKIFKQTRSYCCKKVCKFTKFDTSDQMNVKNKLKSNKIFYFTQKNSQKRLHFPKTFLKRTICGWTVCSILLYNLIYKLHNTATSYLAHYSDKIEVLTLSDKSRRNQLSAAPSQNVCQNDL